MLYNTIHAIRIQHLLSDRFSSFRRRSILKHIGTQRIETERMILRHFTVEDSPTMFRNWAGDPCVTEYLIWPAYTGESGVAEYLKSVVSQYDNPAFYEWAIVLKALNEPIGSIGCVRLREEIAAMELGYCLGRQWWRHGLAPEALQAVIHFLFTNTDVNRIEAKHDVRNPASGAVMKKCGMQYEGTLRQAARYNQGLCDAALYSILREEFLEKEPKSSGKILE